VGLIDKPAALMRPDRVARVAAGTLRRRITSRSGGTARSERRKRLGPSGGRPSCGQEMVGPGCSASRPCPRQWPGMT